jgi:hypothetical protein
MKKQKENRFKIDEMWQVPRVDVCEKPNSESNTVLLGDPLDSQHVFLRMWNRKEFYSKPQYSVIFTKNHHAVGFRIVASGKKKLNQTEINELLAWCSVMGANGFILARNVSELPAQTPSSDYLLAGEVHSQAIEHGVFMHDYMLLDGKRFKSLKDQNFFYI